jgi:hypothetical protein
MRTILIVIFVSPPATFLCHYVLIEPWARRRSRSASGRETILGGPPGLQLRYCLEKVQINKLNVYLQLKLNYNVCYAYESYLYIFSIIKLN